jgi:hypothetical protein
MKSHILFMAFLVFLLSKTVFIICVFVYIFFSQIVGILFDIMESHTFLAESVMDAYSKSNFILPHKYENLSYTKLDTSAAI